MKSPQRSAAAGAAAMAAGDARRVPAASRPEAPLDATRLNRIRWRCRRGMLENDLVLTRFLDARGPALSEAEVASLDRLLALTDNELWDLIAGRAEAPDAAAATLLQQLRAA